ncbi:MAG: sulfurtransferase [Nevskiaceae bacterium]|jgi:thiosulfate/3-mercaptopyruvate sulfurtransferase|nr:sulfurtransferase [Nevskiaceae bacterium]
MKSRQRIVYGRTTGDDARMMPTPGDAPLVRAPELAALLGDPALLVVDCRSDLPRPEWGLAQYRAGHIPGAVFASLDTALSGPITPDSGRHPLPSPAHFAATLGGWGFTPDTNVVAYDQGAGIAAARLWWMLRARGHRHVRVLEGGFAAWQAAGLPTDTATPVRTPTTVPPSPFAGVVDADEVQRGLAARTLRLIDARGADRFAGENETIDPVAGHVAGARNHPFARNFGPGGLLLDEATLRQSWQRHLQGVEPSQLAMMCGSGITACYNLLALAALGVEGAKLYAGSYSQWIRDPNRRVATGPETGTEP